MKMFGIVERVAGDVGLAKPAAKATAGGSGCR